MSRRNRERKLRAAQSGVADHALFAREFEVVAKDGVTEIRVRPGATIAFGEDKTRLISMLAGIGFVLLGILAWAYMQSQRPGRELSWVALGVLGGIGLLFLLIAWVGGPKGMYLLRVGRGGEVWHRGQVAGPGEVVAVWVECLESRDEEGDPYSETHLYLERRDGRITELPADRFTRLGHFGLARALAARLAKALNVPLNDRSPPDRHSTAARRRQWVNFWGVVVALVVGAAHFSGGFGLLLAGGELRWFGLMFTATGSAAIGLACWLAGWGWRGFGLIVGALATLMILAWRYIGAGPGD